MGRKPLGTRTIICNQCNRSYSYNRSDRKGKTTQKCNSCNVTNKRKELKKQAIEYKGGKCAICGYNKSVEALEFHHLDKSTKLFSMSGKGQTFGWQKRKEELDKCILVCANCHREIEAGITICSAGEMAS